MQIEKSFHSIKVTTREIRLGFRQWKLNRMMREVNSNFLQRNKNTKVYMNNAYLTIILQFNILSIKWSQYLISILLFQQEDLVWNVWRMYWSLHIETLKSMLLQVSFLMMMMTDFKINFQAKVSFKRCVEYNWKVHSCQLKAQMNYLLRRV